MSKVMRCDNCGEEAKVYDYGSGFVHVEANEDADHMDACSWSCLAVLVLNRSLEQEQAGR